MGFAKKHKAADFLQLPFYKPHLFRFLLKSMLYAEHIQYTAEGVVFEGGMTRGQRTRPLLLFQFVIQGTIQTELFPVS